MGTSKSDKMLGGNLQWTSIPSRGSRNTPSRFILQKPEISGGTDEPSGSPSYNWDRLYLTFTFTYNKVVEINSSVHTPNILFLL